MAAEQSNPNDDETVRPGGWVDGIGWVAWLCDLDAYDTAHETEEGPQEADLVQMWTAHDRLRQVVIVKAWADGSTPHASQAPAWAAGYQIGFADGQTPTPPAPEACDPATCPEDVCRLNPTEPCIRPPAPVPPEPSGERSSHVEVTVPRNGRPDDVYLVARAAPEVLSEPTPTGEWWCEFHGQLFSRCQSLKPDRESCGTWPPGSAAAVTPPPVPEAGDEYPPIDGPEERAFCAALIGAHLKVEQISEVLTIYRGVMAGEIATPEGWMPTAPLPVGRPDSERAATLRNSATELRAVMCNHGPDCVASQPTTAARVMEETADWIDAHCGGATDDTVPVPRAELAAAAFIVQEAIWCEGLQNWWGTDSRNMADLGAAHSFLAAAARRTTGDET